MADVTITMLGASGAGKTCFLVGLYNALRMGVKDFTLLATDTDPQVDTDVDLAEAWERMQDGGQDRWPAPTDDSREFTFDLQYAYRTILTIDWLDYRGGAMLDQPSEPDARQLLDRLGRSSAILLCVSAEALLHGPRAIAKTDRMNVLLGRVRRALPADAPPPPVVIVLTKFDLCAAAGLSEAHVTELVKRQFPPLFAPKGGWLVTVCPVTLGHDLSQDRAAAPIAPVHIHLPLTFVACAELRRRIERSTAAVGRLDARRRELGGGMLREWWNAGSIKRATRSLTLEQAVVTRASEDLEFLEDELGAALCVLHSGRELARA